jgi:hypothetical protein
MSSRVNIGTHRFWEAMAIPAGIFLAVHGCLGVTHDDWTVVWRVLSGVELAIGVTTCAVDGWFLAHV